MLREKSSRIYQLIIDFLIITIAFIIAASISISFQILLIRNYMFILLILMYLVWYFSAKSMDYYSGVYSSNFASQFVKILKMVLIQTILTVFFIFAIKENWFIRNFTFIYVLCLLILVSLHSALFLIFNRNYKNRRNIIIIGAGKVGLNFYNTIVSNRLLGFNVVGFVDDNIKENYGITVLGTLAELENVLSEHKIDEAIIALQGKSDEIIDKIIHTCNIAVVRTHIIPDYFKYLAKRFRVGMFGNFPIITVRNEPLEELHWKLLKRSLDIIVSIIVIFTFVSWMFPIFFLIQKLSSKGPIFFNQIRIGKNKKNFTCFKFRTMHVNVSSDQYRPTIKNDSRITKFGAFLRRSNLDETPQIFNVLLGNMSLVGPRPHPLPYHNFTKEFFDEIEIRSLVKPGITGWAQVNGYRGDTVGNLENKYLIGKKLQYDIWYIENWTFGLDIQILLSTLMQMITRKNPGI